MKKIFRYTGYSMAGLIIFILVYLGAAFCLARITVAGEKGQPEDMAIYIKTNGVHTDLVMPVVNEQFDWRREIRFSNTHLQDTVNVNYLAMGWGDKGFYLQTPTWSDLKASVAFKAMTGMGTTAIHATFYAAMPEDASCKKIMISKAQYTRLLSYINNSFQKDSAGHVIPIITNANYTDADAFYEANGSYSIFHTCNTWANNGLKAGGLKACLWTPFDTGIFLKFN